ncbi:MAG: hypothetical protein Q4D98_00870 [Planctomycetia bacterium]|nr:hypothetical protein [Planctomycetia bacterium]
MKYCITTLFLWGFALFAYAEVNLELKKEILTTKDEAVLIRVIEKMPTNEEELYLASIACKQLASYGSDKAVPALAKMLSEPKLNHYARYALVAIPSTAADVALVEAVRTLSGKLQADCIDTLGVRRYLPAVPEIVAAEGKSDCPWVRKASYEALGRMATDEAIAFLLAEVENNGKADGLATGLLSAAEFRKDRAVEIYAVLAKGPFAAPAKRAGIYRGLLADPDVERLFAGLRSDDGDIFEPSLKAVREISSDVDVCGPLLAGLDRFPVEKRFLVVRALADRDDDGSLRQVFPLLKSWCANPDEAYRVAGVRAMKNLFRVLPREALETVLNVSGATEGLYADVLAASVALPGEVLDAAVVETLKTAPREKLHLLATIAEQRGIFAAAEVLLDLCEKHDADQPVRDRLISAAARLVQKDHLLRFVADVQRLPNETQISLLYQKVCVHLPQEASAAEIVKLYDGEKDLSQKVKLLPVLKVIGGKTALACVSRACWEAATQEVATRILGEWNDPQTIEASAEVCLKLAREATDEKYRIRGLRSYIRIPRQFNLPEEKKIAMCRTFFDTARRPEDKLLVFDVLKRVISPATAEAAFSYASDEACREAACRCVVTIAKEVKGKSPQMATLLERVLATTSDEEVKREAKILAAALK